MSCFCVIRSSFVDCVHIFGIFPETVWRCWRPARRRTYNCAYFLGFYQKPRSGMKWLPGDTSGITQFSGFWQELSSDDEW